MVGIWALFLLVLAVVVVALAIVWIVSRRRAREPRGFDVVPPDPAERRDGPKA